MFLMFTCAQRLMKEGNEDKIEHRANIQQFFMFHFSFTILSQP